jgi:Glyoxalase-like domain
MRLEVDHVFVCVAHGAPEAERLLAAGFTEGTANEHPGQGTACRRFNFRSAMLELVWVSDEAEARGPTARRTMLWERWSRRGRGASPFGVCVRPEGEEDSAVVPFAGWQYEPEYLQAPLAMHIGNAVIEEPMWVYMGFLRRTMREQWFLPHANGASEITGLTLVTPVPLVSDASRRVVEGGALTVVSGAEHLMRIELDGGVRGESVDLRPELPVVFVR